MFIFNYSMLVDLVLKDVRVYTPKFSGMEKGDKVLDVCCGTGDQVFHYRKIGIIATGIDSDPKMIEIANRRKEKDSFNNVSFQVADARKLPFEDVFFDFASISFGLHEKERIYRDRIISEMKRVVKKEGFLIFIDFQVPLPRITISYLAKIIEYFAGKNHYKCFKDYLKQGGLPTLLKKNKLKEEKKDYLKNKEKN